MQNEGIPLHNKGMPQIHPPQINQRPPQICKGPRTTACTTATPIQVTMATTKSGCHSSKLTPTRFTTTTSSHPHLLATT